MDKRIFDIVRYAKYNVPFYSNLYHDIFFEEKEMLFEKLPLVSKNNILNSEYSNISFETGKIDSKRLIYIPTSGSTGKCLKVIWRDSDYKNSLLPLWILRKKRYGIEPHDRLCCFFTNQYNGRAIAKCDEVIIADNKMLINKNNLNPQKLKIICERIIEFSPRWMILQPSMAVLLCQCIKNNNLRINDNFKYIELTGEKLFSKTRNLIQEVFNCTIANQYGCNEVNSIAYECECGNLHLMQDCTYTELFYNGKKALYGEEGDIYVTSMCNYIMPFIRYETGDRGILYPASSCSCGNKGDVLKLLTGRNSDWILNSDGSRIGVCVFVHAFEVINYIMDDVIRQFQIIQNDYDKFTVKLVVEDDIIDDEDEKVSIGELFMQSLDQDSLRKAEYKFEFYNNIFPDEISRKHKLLINNILSK